MSAVFHQRSLRCVFRKIMMKLEGTAFSLVSKQCTTRFLRLQVRQGKTLVDRACRLAHIRNRTNSPRRSRTRIMARNYSLSFYLILNLLTSLHSLETSLFRPLLRSSDKYLAHMDHENPEAPLLQDSFTNFQAGSQKANSGDGKYILQITKGRLNKFFTDQPQTLQNKALASWEVYYDIAQKVKNSELREVREMASAVSAYGRQFGLHRHLSPEVTEHIISTINIFALSLESDSLNTAVTIWSVGVISYLRSQIPRTKTFTIPDLWTANDLGRPRAHFLLFFLQDKDLGEVAQEMWSEIPSKLETSEPAIQEAVQRESIVYHINQQIGKAPRDTSTDFKPLYLAFINLKTPIDSAKASSLMKLIANRLAYSEPQRGDGFDNEANTVRLLLHLEEYHYQSYLNFKELSNRQNLREKILKNDVVFQIADKNLPPSVLGILKEFQNIKFIRKDHITKVLDIIKQEKMSILQLGRFFRVLNLVFKSNHEMYKSFNLELDRYFLMLPQLSLMLNTYRDGRMNPRGDKWEILESLIFIKNEDLLAKKYRSDLANALVAKGVISESEVDEHYFPGESKEHMVDCMLYGIFKKTLDAKTSKYGPTTRHMLIEYILHLLSFKNNDKLLYFYLLSLANESRKFPDRQSVAFYMLSQPVSRFLDGRSWDTNGQMDEFRTALWELEESVLLEKKVDLFMK